MLREGPSFELPGFVPPNPALHPLQIAAPGIGLGPRIFHRLIRCFGRVHDPQAVLAGTRDPYCPIPGGGLPDCGAIIAAVEACTGHKVEEVMGKPSPIMADVILARMALPPRDVLVTGDRLETDIALARGAGMVSALVLTGATPAEALKTSPLQPDYVLRSLSDLLPPQASA